jgi:hypothetical protein
VAPSFAERYKSVSSLDTTLNTLEREGRYTQITTITADIALRNPLGGGMDNLGPGASFSNSLLGLPTRPQFENTENQINMTLLGLGIPGLLIWLGLHLWLLRLCWQARQRIKEPELKTYLGSGLLLMLLLLLNWPFGALILFPANVLFWLIPGMILGTAEEYTRLGPDGPSSNR